MKILKTFLPFVALIFLCESSFAQNNYVGIGVAIGKNNGTYVIQRLLRNGPADKAGLMKGDKLVKIDQHAVGQLSLQEVVRLIKGEAGTSVTLLINRNGVKNQLKATRGTVKTHFIIGCIEGDCKNGKGTKGYKLGIIYSGQFENGKRKGKGVINIGEKTIQSYHWDEMNNENIDGKIIYEDGSTWEGFISQKTFKANGYGNRYSVNGANRYSGTVYFEDGDYIGKKNPNE